MYAAIYTICVLHVVTLQFYTDFEIYGRGRQFEAGMG